MNCMKIGILMAMLMVLVGSVSAGVYASDSTGLEKNTFGTGETVYVTGDGLEPGHKYCVYVVDDVIDWSTVGGTPLVERSNDADGDGYLFDNATADGDGDFIVAVWTPTLTPGDYDVVADYGCDGNYDIMPDIAATDSLNVPGFSVVPESVIAVAMIALFVPGIIYVVRRKKE